MTLWVGSSEANFSYAAQLGVSLCKEYTQRYGKTHACEKIIIFLRRHPPRNFNIKISPKATYAKTDNPPGTTAVPLCMDEQFHSDSLVNSYRAYYQTSKREICTWKYSQIPEWF